MEKQFIINEKLLSWVLNYLSTKPYGEVVGSINDLSVLPVIMTKSQPNEPVMTDPGVFKPEVESKPLPVKKINEEAK